jgi:hypothetical protein
MKKFILNYFYLSREERQFVYDGLALIAILLFMTLGTFYGLYYLNLWLN